MQQPHLAPDDLSALEAHIISALEAYLQASQDQIQTQQAKASRMRFILQALRDGSDISSILKKDEIASSTHVDMRSLSNVEMPSNGNHVNANGIDTGFKDRYLRTAKAWITETIKANRTPLMPGQLYRMAAEANIKMHKNYPYVVLKQLVKEGIVKQVGRGYAATIVS